jgi:hypothetical protein
MTSLVVEEAVVVTTASSAVAVASDIMLYVFIPTTRVSVTISQGQKFS